MRRISLYLGKDRDWLIEILRLRVEGAKLTGRKTSMGQELLYLAEQHILKEMYDLSKRSSSEDTTSSDGDGR